MDFLLSHFAVSLQMTNARKLNVTFMKVFATKKKDRKFTKSRICSDNLE